VRRPHIGALKGNRGWAAVRRAPLQAGHYRALAGMVMVYPRFWPNLYRFLTARGAYPYVCRVRTPVGEVAPTLYSSHDISTVNEIFCRRDYDAPADLRVAVDFGANIGIAALYFLTRNRISRVHCFEPNPRNLQRLRATLAGLENRYVLHEVAVGLSEGPVSFGVEPSGRYGGIGTGFDEQITVRCREVNAVLEDILRAEGRIDVLKVDVETLEHEIVSEIAPDLLDRIGLIYYETGESDPMHLDRFEHRFSSQTNRLRRRATRGPVPAATD
jgi:FkbM family methyltransferase